MMWLMGLWAERAGECAATAKMAGYRHEQMAGRVGPKGGCNPTVAPDPTGGAGS
jgi:hypothetical protein